MIIIKTDDGFYLDKDDSMRYVMWKINSGNWSCQEKMDFLDSLEEYVTNRKRWLNFKINIKYGK